MRTVNIKQVAFCVAVFLTLTYTSCRKDKEQKLIGKWRISNMEIYCTDPEQDAFRVTGNYGFYKPGLEMLDGIKKNYIEHGELYEFSVDNKFYHEKLNAPTFYGKYKIKDDSLILTTEKGMVDGYKINFISDTKFEYSYTLPLGDKHLHTYTYYYDKMKE